MRGRLDRPVTEEERRQIRDPFAAWGGYVEATSDPRSRFYTAASIHNDFRQDHELKKELTLGIPFLGNLQDRAMTETMGPIYDRTQEHLGTTDAMVIFMRRRLIDAAGRCATRVRCPSTSTTRISVEYARPRPCCPK